MPEQTEQTSQLEKLFKLTKSGLAKDEGVSIHQAGDPSISSYVPFGFPSGIPQLDYALGGRGGLPAGKIIEYYGIPMCGKTTAVLQAMAEVQKLGGACLFVDTEKSWDEDRALDLGVNIEKVMVADADTIESSFRTIEATLDNLKSIGFNRPFLFAVDSVTGAPSEDEASNTLSAEARVGQEAKQIRRGVKRLASRLSRSKCTLIFINHSIATIKRFGKENDSAGGRAIKFYSSVRVEFSPISVIRDSQKNRAGQNIGIKIEKLKGADLSHDRFNVALLNETGFDQSLSLLDATIDTGFVHHTKGAKVYTLNKGTEQELQFMKDEWKSEIANLGGYDKVYKAWVDNAVEHGKMRLWGESKYSLKDES